MKYFEILIRILFGGIFVLYGLSKFHAFMPTPPMELKAAQFIGALISTGYLWQLIGFVEVICGVLIVLGQFLPIALVLISPIVINILFYLLILQKGLPPIIMSGFLIFSILFLAYQNRVVYYSLFQRK